MMVKENGKLVHGTEVRGLKTERPYKGKIEFEDIWKRRVVVTYYSWFDKLVYRMQLWFLRKVKKVITKIYIHEKKD